MKLTCEEFDYIAQQLNRHDIKYQEIYDELKDHLISAIETARKNGDERNIAALYQDMVSSQFPGYWPFDEIVKQYQTAYWRKISKAVWGRFGSYFNWKTIPLMILGLVITFYLPQTKNVLLIMMAAMIMVGFYPVLYVFLKTRHIRTDKGKRSLTKGYLITTANLTMLCCNVLFNIVAPISRMFKPAHFLNPIHFPPLIFMILFVLTLIYGLSCVEISKKEFKTVVK